MSSLRWSCVGLIHLQALCSVCGFGVCSGHVYMPSHSNNQTQTLSFNLSGRKVMATRKDGHRDRTPPEESYGGKSSVPCPGDTLPWNLSKHQRIKRSKSASGEVLDPAERAVIRIAGRMRSHTIKCIPVAKHKKMNLFRMKSSHCCRRLGRTRKRHKRVFEKWAELEACWHMDYSQS